MITSPELASEFAILTPTPRPTATTIPATALIANQPPAQPLAPNTVVTGELTSGDGRMQDGTYVDRYLFTGAPGQIVTLQLRSTQFDTVLALTNADDEVIAYNDDFFKGATDSRLELALPQPGAYAVLVNTYDLVAGAYTLQLTVADHRQQGDHLPIGTPAQGWLLPGDATNAAGLLMDQWRLTMPAEPVVVWARSTEFDVRLDALNRAGQVIGKNGDLDRIGLEHDARLLLMPSAQLAAGSPVTLTVALQGEFAVGGAYDLLALPLSAVAPETGTPTAVVKVRPVIVKGAEGQGGSQATPAQLLAAVAHANAVWQTCGIAVVAEDNAVKTVAIPGMEGSVQVQSDDWTPQENTLMAHPLHALPAEGVITAFFVHELDGGERYGLAYPTTRYPAGRSGLVLVADVGATEEAFLGTLAHEIGHILGLNHPDLDDGDPLNDTQANVMFTSEGVAGELTRVYGGLTPLQCMTARAARHFLHFPGEQIAIAPALQRSDRVLQMGDHISGSLTTRDALLSTEGEQFLDVYYFHGQADTPVTIELAAAAFDPILLLQGPDGEQIAMDDDGGGGLQAQINVTLPQSGDYSIGVTSFRRAVGAYELRVAAKAR